MSLQISREQLDAYITRKVQAFREGEPRDFDKEMIVRAVIAEHLLLDLLTGWDDVDQLRKKIIDAEAKQ